MLNSIVCKTPAKVNLFLHVNGKLPSGYHSLQSVFVYCNLYDTITIQSSNAYKLTYGGRFASFLPQNPSCNLLTKLVHILSLYRARNHTKNSPPSGKPNNCLTDLAKLHIQLLKEIPVGAGLGGGSGNVAGLLKIFNQAGQLHLPDTKLHEIALQLGADIPAALHNSPCFVQGVGDKIKPLHFNFSLPILLVFPNLPNSTAKVFDGLSAQNYQSSLTSRQLEIIESYSQPNNQSAESLLQLLHNCGNSLINSASALNNSITTILEYLKTTKPLFYAMSGSGSTCFALYLTQEQLLKAKRDVNYNFPNYFVFAGNTLTNELHPTNCNKPY